MLFRSVGFTGLNYELKTGLGAVAGLKGTARQFDLGLAYPVLRRVGRSADLAVVLQQKALDDKSIAGALRGRNVTAVQTTLSGRWQSAAWGTSDQFQAPAFNTASIGLRTGRLDLSRVAADSAADAAGLRTAGSYTSLQYAASREQLLPFVGNRLWSTYVQVRGQASNKNLDASEQFSLGGRSGVRGYPAGEANGDSGFIATLEARYAMQQIQRLQAFGFFDTGRIRLQNTPGAVPIASITGNNTYGLSSGGLGLRYVSPNGKVSAELILAKAVGANDGRSIAGNNADGLSSRSRVWFTLTYSL